MLKSQSKSRSGARSKIKVIAGIKYVGPRVLHPQQLVDLNLSNSNIHTWAGLAGCTCGATGRCQCCKRGVYTL